MTLGSVLLSPRRARAWPQCPKCPGRSGELQREECTPPPPPWTLSARICRLWLPEGLISLPNGQANLHTLWLPSLEGGHLRCWPPSQPWGPGLGQAEAGRWRAWRADGGHGGQTVGRGLGARHVRPAEELGGAPRPRERVGPGPQGRQWGHSCRGPGSFPFPVLFLSLALCPGQQPTCLQGSCPWAPSPQVPPPVQLPCEAVWEVGAFQLTTWTGAVLAAEFRQYPVWAKGSPKGA